MCEVEPFVAKAPRYREPSEGHFASEMVVTFKPHLFSGSLVIPGDCSFALQVTFTCHLVNAWQCPCCCVYCSVPSPFGFSNVKCLMPILLVLSQRCTGWGHFPCSVWGIEGRATEGSWWWCDTSTSSLCTTGSKWGHYLVLWLDGSTGRRFAWQNWWLTSQCLG